MSNLRSIARVAQRRPHGGWWGGGTSDPHFLRMLTLSDPQLYQIIMIINDCTLLLLMLVAIDSALVWLDVVVSICN